jgi:purine-binding chemotaxis protein CheW
MDMIHDATQVARHEAARQQGAASAPGREYLSFRLGAEEYGIDILKVQEIRGYDHVTRIASTPEWLKGVINLRGTIVPIVDMRIRFNLGRAQYDQFTVVIILNIARRTVGMVVDSVSDVLTLAGDQVRPAPELSGTMDTRYITGLGTVEGRMIILADIERLMTSREMDLVEERAASTA